MKKMKGGVRNLSANKHALYKDSVSSAVISLKSLKNIKKVIVEL